MTTGVSTLFRRLFHFLTNLYLIESAEQALLNLGSSWEWLEDGSLKTITSIVPAVRVDQGDNRSNTKTFFNSIVAAYTGWNDSRNDGSKAVMTSDGQYLDPIFMKDAEAIMLDICVAIPWQAGDLLLLDNRATMHSRRIFEGPRRILAALARDPR